MSDVQVLDAIGFRPDLDLLLKKLRIQQDSQDAIRLDQLARQATAIARPRAAYRLVYIESKGHNTVVANGITLTSRVLRVNLEEVHRLFAFVATCGRELHDWIRSIDDMLEQYWADAIGEMALRTAVDALKGHITTHYQPGPTSSMSPGSLKDWPIEQQRPLFDLVGDVRAAIGVELTDSFLMVPIKSLSGISFPTEVRFESCQLCPRELCPGRRAPYDPGLYDRKYAGQDRQGATDS